MQERWELESLQNVLDYANHHGYHLAFSGRLDEQRGPAWSKVKAWEHLLRNYDWVWQSDLDVLIMNFHQRLETFLDDRYDIIVGRDCRIYHEVKGTMSDADALGVAFNPGSFFMKSSQWTIDFLDKVWAANTSDERFVDWWEQAAVLKVIAEDPSARDHIKIVPGRKFSAWAPNRHFIFDGKNSTVCDHESSMFYQPGDFAVQFVGAPGTGPGTDLSAYVGQAGEAVAGQVGQVGE